MTKSNPNRARLAAALTAGAVALSSPARSDTIYSLNVGAACRDKTGVVETPRSAPPLAAPAEMTAFGMVHVTGGWNNPNCYFYMSEVGLHPPRTAGGTACPLAAVSQEKARVAGTRDLTQGCSK